MARCAMQLIGYLPAREKRVWALPQVIMCASPRLRNIATHPLLFTFGALKVNNEYQTTLFLRSYFTSAPSHSAYTGRGLPLIEESPKFSLGFPIVNDAEKVLACGCWLPLYRGLPLYPQCAGDVARTPRAVLDPFHAGPHRAAAVLVPLCGVL